MRSFEPGYRGHATGRFGIPGRLGYSATMHRSTHLSGTEGPVIVGMFYGCTVTPAVAVTAAVSPASSCQVRRPWPGVSPVVGSS